MARFPQQKAEKGSQRWLQILVNEKPEILNSLICSSLSFVENEFIEWRSPLKSDGYAEYRDQAFLDRLGITLEKAPLQQFWPKGGPQWDALARSSSGKLFLVEAKSHIPELISSLRATDKKSIKRIKQSLKETKKYLNSTARADWSQGFYQYTNRLGHLFLLREKNNLPAYLIDIYFLSDVEMNGPSTSNEWKGAIELLNSYLGIRKHELLKYTSNLFININTTGRMK
jgi:hypothetical protein